MLLGSRVDVGDGGGACQRETKNLTWTDPVLMLNQIFSPETSLNTESCLPCCLCPRTLPEMACTGGQPLALGGLSVRTSGAF